MTNQEYDVERMAEILSGTLVQFAKCIEELTVTMQALRFALNGEDVTITTAYIAKRINRLEEKCDAAFTMVKDGKRLSDIESKVRDNSRRLDAASKQFASLLESVDGSTGSASKRNPGGPENTAQGNP